MEDNISSAFFTFLLRNISISKYKHASWTKCIFPMLKKVIYIRKNTFPYLTHVNYQIFSSIKVLKFNIEWT